MYWASSDAQMEELTIPYLGPERAHLQYPFASLARAGARLAMGSDWSVSTAHPLTQIEVGATRVDPATPEQPAFLPEERITVASGMEAFTLGSAYVNHDERGGRLEIGRRADLALLGADITQGRLAAGHGLSQVPVVLTIAGGTIVLADL
jgi:predicted amidohydrolase YtcJ